ncbi:hypothetical protein ABID81_002964 [Frigoribacterium sp. PvP054]|uniref:hypothetical protein n=1 Tax=Frigoribacterium sp. PvP054 TaxID=3156438 RepID=UPI0033940BC1
MGLGIDINGSRELQATVLSLRQASKEMQSNVRKYTREQLLPEWQKGLAERAETRLEHRVLVDTGRVKMSNQNVRLSSATVGRKLRGGLNPKTQAYAVEFGGDRSEYRGYESRRGGTNFTVRRRTQAQLRPRRRNGYVVYPTAKALVPRFASLWVQTVVRSFYDAIERK